MRNTLTTVALLTLALAPSVARADNADAVAGTFEVKYEEITSNCQNTGMVLARGTIAIEKRKGSTIAVDIERMPMMSGTASKGGRIKAASKLGKTSIQGLDGKFSIAGTVNADRIINIVFVAEYYLSRKAYCTQSWTVTGTAKDDGKTPASDDASTTLSTLSTRFALSQPFE